MLACTVTYVGALDRHGRSFKRLLKQALITAALYWHEHFLPKHFGLWSQVSARYPGVYTPRARGTQMQKARKFHHQRYLVFSGQLERNVTTRGIRPVGSATEIRIRLPGSQVANFKPRAIKKTPPNMRAELTTVNQEESTKLAEVVDAQLTELLASRDETWRPGQRL